MALNVFGKVNEDSIYLPNKPYAVRLNCKSGAIHKTETKRICDEAEVSIIAIEEWYGNLGKTLNENWLQIFFVPLHEQGLPANTVCVTYIKRESSTLFADKITELLATKTNPAHGIFKIYFEPRQGRNGPYFVVLFDWRPRKGKGEQRQLELIEAFMEGPQRMHMLDMDATRDMVPVGGLPAHQRLALAQASSHGLSPRYALRAAEGEAIDTLTKEMAENQAI
jgi:hypothetical protein